MISAIRWIRAVMRIEMRSMAANWMRTLMVGALIALPVAAIIVGNNLLFITTATSDERAASVLGIADIRIASGSPLEQLKAKLPEGSILEPIAFAREQVVANGLSLSVETSRLNLQGLASGLRIIVEGNAPKLDSEIALSRELLSVSKKSLGDSLNVGDAEYEIVGVVENTERLNELAVLYPHLNGPAVFQGEVLVKLPHGADPQPVVDSLDGVEASTRTSVLNQREDESFFIFVVGCFALAEAALIVSAAFIVGIRRRQREIGLLASTGATRFQVLASVLISAVMTSCIAATVGLAVGMVIAWIAHPYLDQWIGRRSGAFEVCWGKHLVATVLGVLTAVASAFFPAIATSRMPAKVALSSRRPVPGGVLKWVAAGILFVLTGYGLVVSAPGLLGSDDSGALPMMAVIFGSIFGIVGFGMCSAWLLGLAAKFSSKLPLPWRLAVRETGRFRTRNGPIVTAIVAGMSLSVLFATIYQSVNNLDSQFTTMFQDNQILVVGPASEQASRKLVNEFGAEAVARLSIATLNGSILNVTSNAERVGSPRLAIDNNGELLKAAGIDDVDGTLQRALNEGKILKLTEAEISTADIVSVSSKVPLASLDVVEASEATHRIGLAGFVISSSTLKKFAWHTREGMGGRGAHSWLVRMNQVVDGEVLGRAAEIASEFPQTTVTAQLNFTSDRSPLWSFFLVSFLTGLVVVGIATALASAEAKSDQTILTTVGAAPSVSRHQSAARSAFLALMGSVLAIPAGMLPAYGLLATISELEFSVPWIELIFIVVGLPLAAYVVTWALSFGYSIRTQKLSAKRQVA